MRKLSAAEIQRIMSDGSIALTKLAAQRDAAVRELEELKRRMEAEKLAHAMHSQGAYADKSLEDLSAYLEEQSRDGQLPVIKEAMKMFPPNMGSKTASLASDEPQGGALHPFEQFLLGGRLGDVG